MIFDTDYWNSLNKREREAVQLNPKQLGYSLGGDPLKNLKTGIFMGTNEMELTFFNSPGKGQQKNTPESWGKTERQEMKELARVNEIEVTTHATPNMGGGGASFSGFTGRDFSDEARQKAVDEMARAAEFAADVGGGGPVVFHMDGFPRPVFSAGFDEGEDKGHFMQYEEEKKKAPLYFVDSRTGKVQAVSREQEVFIAPKKDPKTGDYMLDEKGEYPNVRPMTFEKVLEEYKTISQKEKDEVGNSPFNYFYKQLKTGQTEEMEARREEYNDNVKTIKANRKIFQDLLKDYEVGVKKAKDPERAKKIFVNILSEKINSKERNGDNQEIRDDPEKFIKERLEKLENNKVIYETGVLGYTRQIEQEKAEVKAYQDITSYGVGKEADTIAESAMRALKIEEKKKLDKPLWVAPENWAAEMYGSHPREYRNIITKSREKMAEKLQKTKGYTKDEAKKVAEDHIRGTFDIGHLNMWKKYFKVEKGKDEDKEFAKWVEKNVRGLIKDKIIGHVHLSDNFGYHDEHIELGEGNAPIQEFFKMMKEEGYEGKTIAEPGGQREGQLHRVWTSALELGNSPVYRIDSTSQSWTDIGGSYFGRTQSPTFMVGDYAPSKDWTLWSETPFE